MKKEKTSEEKLTIAIGAVALAVFIAAIGALAVGAQAAIYRWVASDVLAGFVQAGLLPVQLSLWQVLKLDIAIATILGLPVAVMLGAVPSK